MVISPSKHDFSPQEPTGKLNITARKNIASVPFIHSLTICCYLSVFIQLIFKKTLLDKSQDHCINKQQQQQHSFGPETRNDRNNISPSTMSLYKPSPRRSQRLEKMKGKTYSTHVINQLTEPVSPFDELMRYHENEDIKVDEVVKDDMQTNCTTIATRKKSSSPPVYTKESRHDNINDDVEGRDPDHDVSRSEFASDMSRYDRDGGTESGRGGGGEGGGGVGEGVYLHQYYPQYGHLQHLYISNEKKNNRRRCEDRSKRHNHRQQHENHQRQDPRYHRQKSDNRISGKYASNLHRKPSKDDPHQVPIVITVPGIIESTESKDTSEVSLDDTLWTTKNGKTKTKPNSNNMVKSPPHLGRMKSSGAVSNEKKDELSSLLSSSRKLSFDTRDDNEDTSLFDYPDPPLDVPFMKVSIINDFWPSDEELDVPSPRKKKYSNK